MKKNIIIGSVVIILFLITGLVIYKSNALYKTSDTHNFINSKANVFVSEDFAYTGNSQEFIVPQSGYYKIELWGASGGITDYAKGANGGYTKGIIKLNKGEKLYFYTGGKANGATGGFNGGASVGSGLAQVGSGGGGATDVRLVSGLWSDSTSLRSRIMVAGGGGGTTGVINSNGIGGNLIGGTGQGSADVLASSGGKQTQGGYYGTSPAINSGSFGIGGTYGTTTVNQPGGGGGGGYYGGGGGQYVTNYTMVGGKGAGGSSYISGYAGVNSVLETGGTAAQPNHTNNTIHYSGKYFINGHMEAGINNGDGKAIISYVGNIVPSKTNSKLNNVRYIKDCINGSVRNTSNHWVEIQAIKNGINIAKGKNISATSAPNSAWQPLEVILDGDITTTIFAGTAATGLQCITIDLGEIYDLDELAIWRYYEDGRVYYQNTLSLGVTNTIGTASLSNVLHTYSGTIGYLETSQGKRYTAWD